MRPPDTTVHKAMIVSYEAGVLIPGLLTDAKYERDIADATFGSRNVIDRLKIDG